jgi:sec-independent protein translocase protein TatA
MLGSLGMPELIVIFVIALIVFGPRKLPELGRSLGRGINEFKKATSALQSTLEDEVRAEEQRDAAAKVSPPPATATAATVHTEETAPKVASAR